MKNTFVRSRTVSEASKAIKTRRLSRCSKVWSVSEKQTRAGRLFLVDIVLCNSWFLTDTEAPETGLDTGNVFLAKN